MPIAELLEYFPASRNDRSNCDSSDERGLSRHLFQDRSQPGWSLCEEYARHERDAMSTSPCPVLLESCARCEAAASGESSFGAGNSDKYPKWLSTATLRRRARGAQPHRGCGCHY